MIIIIIIIVVGGVDVLAILCARANCVPHPSSLLLLLLLCLRARQLHVIPLFRLQIGLCNHVARDVGHEHVLGRQRAQQTCHILHLFYFIYFFIYLFIYLSIYLF